MKKIMLIVIIILSGTFTLQAQKMPEKRFKKAEQNYLTALTSENTGLIEDAVFCVLIFYARFPDNDFSKMEAQLRELAFNGATTMIQIKAYMACQSLNSRSWFKEAKTAMAEHNPDEMFLILSNHFIEKKTMAAKH